MLDAPEFLLGVVALALVIGPLALGAMRLRQRLLVGWSGAPAYLADAVLTLALLILIAELIGAVGLLERVPLVASCIAVGVGLRLALPEPTAVGPTPPPVPPGGVWGARVAVLIAAALVAHWSIDTVGGYGSGMTSYDSNWYHMPFAANFVQTGSTVDFALVSPRYLSWFYPQNSELLHGVGIVLTQRDVLSPGLNLIWLVGCLGAAWCIGRPYGLGAWTVVGAAVVLDSGVMADQAGEARNDTVALFFLLAAVAFLVNGAAAVGGRRIAAGPLVIAGLAAGLAAGVKLSFLVPVAALVVGVPLLAAPGRRRIDLIAFGAPVLVGCGFWYLRNLFTAGNPLPWAKSIGPLQLPGPDQGLGGRPQHSVLGYFGDGQVWNDSFEPALTNRLGELWPVILAVAVVAAIVALLRGPGLLRVVAAAACTAGLFYLVDGTSAEGPPGDPVGFASSLRHLLPMICLGLVLVPLLPGLGSRRGRAATATLLAVLLVAADRSAEPWPAEYVVVAVLLGAAGLAALLFPRSDLRRRIPRPALAASCATLIGTLLVGGWFLQRSYLSDRYRGNDFRSEGLNAAYAWASGQQDQRIVTSLILLYPLFGTEISNRVEYLGMRVSHAGFIRPRTCAEWLRVINRGRFDYLVLNDRPGVVDRDSAKQLARTNARLVFERKLIDVFRLDGPLDRGTCRDVEEPHIDGGPPLGRARDRS